MNISETSARFPGLAFSFLRRSLSSFIDGLGPLGERHPGLTALNTSAETSLNVSVMRAVIPLAWISSPASWPEIRSSGNRARWCSPPGWR